MLLKFSSFSLRFSFFCECWVGNDSQYFDKDFNLSLLWLVSILAGIHRPLASRSVPWPHRSQEYVSWLSGRKDCPELCAGVLDCIEWQEFEIYWYVHLTKLIGTLLATILISQIIFQVTFLRDGIGSTYSKNLRKIHSTNYNSDREWIKVQFSQVVLAYYTEWGKRCYHVKVCQFSCKVFSYLYMGLFLVRSNIKNE